MNEIRILLVEDNEGDILLTLEAFSELPAATSIDVVRDGAEALAYLRKEGKYSKTPLPQLILLDINMPGMNGIELLEHIKSDELLKRIPVLMLTTSSSSADIKACYDRSANCFITKPIDFGKFQEVVENIERFWFRTVQLPGAAA
ncbi:MAG TPA: response regulator [Chitinophagaceae bacterium]|nr:response regulator [Chitinophagaceae bacterium]